MRDFIRRRIIISKTIKLLLGIVLLAILLTGCGELKLTEYKNISYQASYRIERGAGEDPFTAVIFKSEEGTDVVLFDNSNQSITKLMKKGETYSVYASVADTFNYGDCIISANVSE